MRQFEKYLNQIFEYSDVFVYLNLLNGWNSYFDSMCFIFKPNNKF